MQTSKSSPFRNFFRNEKKADPLLLCLLILAHTAALFVISDFCKRIISYPDELVYIDAAKSLISGAPIAAHETTYSLGNLLYPWLLSPFMLIKDTLLRIRLFSLLNSFLLSLIAWPVYKIGEELGARRAVRWTAVLILMVWPDLLLSAMMMSEALYWPLAAFAFLFCVRSFKNNRLGDAAAAGVLCYLCYYCRDIALCLALAYAALQICFPFLEAVGKKGWFKAFLKGLEWKSLAVFLAVFMLCRLLTGLIPGPETPDNRLAGVSVNVLFGSGTYNIFYWLYDMLSYFLCAVTAFFILPVLAPAATYRTLDKAVRKSYLYGIILLLGTVVTVATIIGTLEDMGIAQMRIHLRYFTPYIMLFLPVYLASLSEKDHITRSIENKRFGIAWFLVALFMVLQAFVMQEPQRGPLSEHLPLSYFHLLRDRIGEIAQRPGSSISFDLASTVTSLLLCSLLTAGFVVARWQKTRKFALPFFAVVAASLCLVNTWWGFGQVRLHYSVSPAVRDDLTEINRYLNSSPETANSNVLYVCDVWYLEDAQAYDLYLDAGREYNITRDTLRQALADANNGEVVLKDTTLRESLWGVPFTAEKMDYLIESAGHSPSLPEMMTGLTPVLTTGNGVFTLYKNENSAAFSVETDPKADRLLQTVYFTQGNMYNAGEFVVRGISGCEGPYSWTDGKELEVAVPLPAEAGIRRVTVELETHATYHGGHTVVVSRDGAWAASGYMDGADVFSFNLEIPENDPVCRFTVRLDNASSPLENGESGDGRLLALAMRRIRVYRADEPEKSH
ncbi:MAG: glycosyltransferase family 39 protein [Clostridia bacterium]|nr:glycosyltransferase family 39 protein [Clostridia bacterium]